MRKTLFAVPALAALCLLAGTVQASEHQGGGPPPLPRKEFCQENPGKCEEARARRKEWCAANPDKCDQLKAKRKERKEFCKANPEKCKEQRAALKAKRDELRAKCQADPKRCDELKQDARDRFERKLEERDAD